jgi:hypothetical protein
VSGDTRAYIRAGKSLRSCAPPHDHPITRKPRVAGAPVSEDARAYIRAGPGERGRSRLH